MKITQQIWGSVQSLLQEKLDNSTFESWLKPIAFSDDTTAENLVLIVPTKFMRDWVKREYGQIIKESIEQVIGSNPSIEFKIQPFAAAQTETLVAKKQAEEQEDEVIKHNTHHIQPKTTRTEPKKEQKAPETLLAHSNVLDPRYTFDNFVIGKSNEFAYAASRRISEGEDNTLYNPFFLHGDVGLGKTHLMHAMAHQITESGLGKKVLYMSSEKFLSQFVQSMRTNDMIEFKERFRTVDVLMIDDVQFLAGKEGTQEEFFHTFNALVDMNKRIILTADKSPHELSGIEDRLRSRLGCGLTTEVHRPGLETRLAILQSKSKNMGVELSSDVAMLLADKISSNVRELEGALNRLIAHSQLTQQEITIDTVHQLLQDLFRNHNKIITLDEIQKKIAEYYNIKMADMHSARRSRDITRPRQIAMYLSKRLTAKSLPEIGRSFGGRDHTTVIHAVKAVDKLQLADPSIAEDLKILENLLSK
jgi:chromosomal replication initiator protein